MIIIKILTVTIVIRIITIVIIIILVIYVCNHSYVYTAQTLIFTQFT